MSETRVHAGTLLCKIFLHYLVLLSEWDGMLDLWLRILDVLDRMMNSGQGEALEEAIPENLKNILLVMADGGYLKREEGERLWEETRRRLERFLPKLIEEIFPNEKERKRPDEAAAAAAATAAEGKGGGVENKAAAPVPAPPTTDAAGNEGKGSAKQARKDETKRES